MSNLHRTLRGESPLGALGRGLLAGAAGTAAMTVYQRVLARGSDDRANEEGSNDDPWANAPAPAQVARRILEGVFRHEVTAAQIPLLTTTMHWSYGSAWGSGYGALQGTLRARPVKSGLGFGTWMWTASYAALVLMGIYRPPWRYPSNELAADLSSHLVYGIATALAYEALAS